MSLNLSVLILARNESRNIAECINSAKLLDPAEIVVIDDGSEDDTVAIAESLGARVVAHAMNGDWGRQRNFAISEARADWIYFIDADERMTEPLAAEIRQRVIANVPTMFANARLTAVCGEWVRHCGWFPDYVNRLAPKAGARVEGRVHESLHCDNVPRREIPSSAHLLHYTYDDFEQYLRKLNQYTTLWARKKHDEGVRSSVAKIVLHPLWGMFKMYVLQRGFLDGRMGLFMTACHGASTFFKYVKLFYYKEGKPS